MFSSDKHSLFTGTLFLSFSGILCRIIGFFYRLFLSRTIGAEGIGIYQMFLPLFTFALSLSASGIQTAISRCCAALLENSKTRKAWNFFCYGFFLSFSLASFLALFFFLKASFICDRFFGSPQYVPFLKLIALSIPFASIHTCVDAWYFAKKESLIPSLGQLFEQLIRVCFSLIMGFSSPLLPFAGLFVGEFGAALFSMLCLFCQRNMFSFKAHTNAPSGVLQKTFLPLAVSFTANRMLLTFLKSAEAILLPKSFTQFGYTDSHALELYGILTGMALPFLLFPTALTTAFSTMLLPHIAREQSSSHNDGIRKTITNTLRYGILFGTLLGIFFFFFGNLIGNLFFKNKTAGVFLHLLSFLCPFFYVNTMLTAIFNGLGWAKITFLLILSGCILRLSFILWVIPHFGIQGYFWGLFLTQALIFLISCFIIRNKDC